MAAAVPSRPLLAAVAITALAAGAVFGWLLREGSAPAAAERVGLALLLPDRAPLPAFRLEATDGSLSPERLRGRWSVLFFGYTHCPDICPTTLAVLAAALGRLPDEARQRLMPVFVSVDPDRDDIERLRAYVGYYGQGLVGTRGTEPDLARLARTLGAYYELGERSGDGGYLVNHSAGLFLVDPEGRFAGVVTPPFDAAQLADTLARLAERSRR